MGSMLLEIFPVSPRGFESFLLDVSALLLEPFSREGVGGLSCLAY